MVRSINVCITVLLLCLLAINSQAARILAVFPHTGKSHFFMFQPFVHLLASRGHQVTVITHFPDPKPPPGVTYVSIRREEDTLFFGSIDMQLLEVPFGSTLAPFGTVANLYGIGEETCRKGLSHPNLQKLIKSDAKFDITLMEFFNTDCFASLAHVFRVPIIGIFPSVMMPWHNKRFGNPDNPAYIPNHFLPLPSRMNLVQRTANTLFTLGTKLVYTFLFDRTADKYVREHIGEDIPPVSEIVANSSLFLVNTHFTLFQPRPMVPGIVEIGGFHVAPPSGKIPADVLGFIEGAPNGVILFSLGSTVRASTMPQYKVEIFQRAFAELKQRVLWKWEEDEMPGKPDNVLISKWLPQNEVLGHKNVVLFVTHSGLMGTEEAVFHGVPMLMLPLFGDQPLNAASCEEKGVGIFLDYSALSYQSLAEALHRLLEDKSYKERAQHLSKMFLDRPLSIMDTAVYWTEYIIKYKGAPQLQAASVHLSWYQEWQIDILFVVSLVIWLIIAILRSLVRLCCCSKPARVDLKKKRK